MELGIIVTNQVLIILGLIIVGFCLTRMGKITEKGAKEMTSVLLMVVTPCVLISSYEKPFNADEAKQLGVAAALALGIHIIAIVLSTIVFKKQKNEDHRRINIFASVYSNCGFMAIPLLTEALGQQGVFYGSMYLAVFTPLYWTHGVYLCTGGDRKEISLKKGFINPGVIGTGVSMLLFISGFWFRSYSDSTTAVIGVLKSVISYLASLNTPLAMLVLGYYIAKINIIECLKKPMIYFVSLIRLIIIPLICIAIVRIIKIPPEIAKAILIPAACPSATVATLFAARYGLDAEYSSEIVSISTVASIVTIPLIVMAFGI